ncbi:MAG TPA: hypothetical protein VL981_05785 [Candidatus Methylacidiphilales bacterium]|nr:hypothetical protein [Candidatus Methylacidiphilales bacterium]
MTKQLKQSEVERKSLLVPASEVDRIRQELAVLKSKVETISSTVEEVSQREPSAGDPLFPLLRSSEEARLPATIPAGTILGYVLGFLAVLLLVRFITDQLRK